MSASEDFTPEALITQEAKKICLEMRPIVEESAGQSFKGYIPLTFRSLNENGKNYLFKVYVDVDKCAHLTIFLNVFHTGKDKASVIDVQYPKAASDPLIFPDTKA